MAELADHAEGKLPEFAHPSEREFARVMDFYRIRWQYEPKTFPIEWDENHNVVKAFTPDFYLPDLDLFIELTTMKQSLVTKKNRKVRPAARTLSGRQHQDSLRAGLQESDLEIRLGPAKKRQTATPMENGNGAQSKAS